MTTENAIAFINDNITTIKVQFFGEINELGKVSGLYNRTYTYKVTKSFAQELALDDLVVVQAKGELTFAQVIEIDEESDIDPQSQIKYKWAICKVDFTEVDHARQQENDFIKQVQTRRRAAYRAKMFDEMGLTKEDAACLNNNK